MGRVFSPALRSNSQKSHPTSWHLQCREVFNPALGLPLKWYRTVAHFCFRFSFQLKTHKQQIAQAYICWVGAAHMSCEYNVLDYIKNSIVGLGFISVMPPPPPLQVEVPEFNPRYHKSQKTQTKTNSIAAHVVFLMWINCIYSELDSFYFTATSVAFRSLWLCPVCREKGEGMEEQIPGRSTKRLFAIAKESCGPWSLSTLTSGGGAYREQGGADHRMMVQSKIFETRPEFKC